MRLADRSPGSHRAGERFATHRPECVGQRAAGGAEARDGGGEARGRDGGGRDEQRGARDEECAAVVRRGGARGCGR